MAVTSSPETTEQAVARLLRQWREETAPLSSSSARTSHPAFLEVIALGQAALPYLLRDLEQTLDGHLAPALTALTGARPVPPEARGKVRAVAEAWLRWARDRGLHW